MRRGGDEGGEHGVSGVGGLFCGSRAGSSGRTLIGRTGSFGDEPESVDVGFNLRNLLDREETRAKDGGELHTDEWFCAPDSGIDGGSPRVAEGVDGQREGTGYGAELR